MGFFVCFVMFFTIIFQKLFLIDLPKSAGGTFFCNLLLWNLVLHGEVKETMIRSII